MTNQILYNRKYGQGKIQMNTVDKPATIQSTTPNNTTGY